MGGGNYEEIKQLLENNKKVLFYATPCQISALNKFLNKSYDNLYCIDIICHGLSSNKILNKYLNEEFNFDKITDINLKSKVYNWTSTIEIKENNKRHIIANISESVYFNAYIKNLILRKSCYNCKFNTIPRQGDITEGDFWGINLYNNEFNDGFGTSVILMNSEKGKYLVDILKNNTKLFEEVPLDIAIKYIGNLTYPSVKHPKRDLFFKYLKKYTFKDSVRRILYNKCDCLIFNYWHTVNYGAFLTCLGVQCLMEDLGYDAKVINYVSSHNNSYKNSFNEAAAEKYLNLTTPVRTYDDFLKLNKYCDTFIVGSDQVWNTDISKIPFVSDFYTMYLLDFAVGNKRRLSYAASTGNRPYAVNEHDRLLYEHFLKKFSAISVREQDSVKMLKDYYNIDNAVQLCDGAFHIPKEKLEEMSSLYKTDEKYIGVYWLPTCACSWKDKVVKDISEKLNLPVKEMYFDRTISIEEWLSFIKNSQFFITDSYHGCLMAIMLNIPFVQIKYAIHSTRMKTIFNMLDMDDFYIERYDTKIDYEKIFAERDWEKINEKIEFEKNRAKEWMKNAMKSEMIFDNYDVTGFNLRNINNIQNQYKNNFVKKEEMNEIIKFISKKNSIIFKYNAYRILSALTHSKKLNEKRLKYKLLMNRLKQLI